MGSERERDREVERKRDWTLIKYTHSAHNKQIVHILINLLYFRYWIETAKVIRPFKKRKSKQTKNEQIFFSLVCSVGVRAFACFIVNWFDIFFSFLLYSSYRLLSRKKIQIIRERKEQPCCSNLMNRFLLLFVKTNHNMHLYRIAVCSTKLKNKNSPRIGNLKLKYIFLFYWSSRITISYYEKKKSFGLKSSLLLVANRISHFYHKFPHKRNNQFHIRQAYESNNK